MVDSNRMLVDGKILDGSSLSPDLNKNASCKEYYWSTNRNGDDVLKCDTISLTLLDWNNESDSKMFDIWLHNYFLMIERDATDAEEIKTISYQREAFRDLGIPVYYREYADDSIPHLDLFFDLGKTKIKTSGKMRLPNTFLRIKSVRYYQVYREKRYCSVVPSNDYITFHNIVKDYNSTGDWYIIKNATHPHVNHGSNRACLGAYSNRFLQYGQEGNIVFYFHTWKQWLKTNNGRDCYQSMSTIYRWAGRFNFMFNKKRGSGIMHRTISHIMNIDSQLILEDTLCRIYVESIKHKARKGYHHIEHISLNPSNHFQKNSNLDIILKQVYQLAVDDYNDNTYDSRYLNFNNLVQELKVRFYAYNGITNKMLEQLKGKELNPKITDEISSKTNYSSLYENDVKYIVRGHNNINMQIDFVTADYFMIDNKSSIHMLVSILRTCYNSFYSNKPISYNEFMDDMHKRWDERTGDWIKDVIDNSSIQTNHKLIKLLYNMYRLRHSIIKENNIDRYHINTYMFNSKEARTNWYEINLNDYCSNGAWHRHYDKETMPDNIDVHMFEERKYRDLCKRVAEATKDEKTNDKFKERTQPKSTYVHSKRKYKFRGLLSNVEPEECTESVVNFFNWTIRKLFMEVVKHINESKNRSELDYESKIKTPKFVVDETDDRQGKLFAPSIPINGVVGSSVVLNKSIREI